jgi:hypothetical protein
MMKKDFDELDLSQEDDEVFKVEFTTPPGYMEEMEELYPGAVEKTNIVQDDIIAALEQVANEGTDRLLEVVKQYREVKPGEWSVFRTWMGALLMRFSRMFMIRAMRESGEVFRDMGEEVDG